MTHGAQGAGDAGLGCPAQGSEKQEELEATGQSTDAAAMIGSTAGAACMAEQEACNGQATGAQPAPGTIHKPKQHRHYRSHGEEAGPSGHTVAGSSGEAGPSGAAAAAAPTAPSVQDERPLRERFAVPKKPAPRGRSRSRSKSLRRPDGSRSRSRSVARRQRRSRSGGRRRERSRSRSRERRRGSRGRSGSRERRRGSRSSRSPGGRKVARSRSTSRDVRRHRVRSGSRSPRRGDRRRSGSRSSRERRWSKGSESPRGRGAGRKRGRSDSPRSPRRAQQEGAHPAAKPCAEGPAHATRHREHGTAGLPLQSPPAAAAEAAPPLAGASPPSSQGRPSMVVRLRLRPSGSKDSTPARAGASPPSQPLSPHERQQQQQDAASPRAPVQAGQRALSPKADAPAAAQHGQHAKQQQQQHKQPGSAHGTPRGAAGALRQRLSFGDELEEDGEEGGGAKEGQRAGSLAKATARRFLRERELVVLHPMIGEGPAAHAAVVDADSTAPPAGGAAVSGGRTLGPVHFGAAMAKGMRPYMEDRHTIVASLLPLSSSGAPIQDGVLRCFAAVYDGHNGALAAEHAADRLHQLLAAEPALRTCTGDGPPSTLGHEADRMGAALRHAFEATDREILVRCRLEGNKSGATGVAVLRTGDVLYAAHAGDSRAVLCRAGGAPLRLTEDHKPNLPRERERVEGAGGRVDFARCWRVIVDPGGGRPASGLAVSRSFGDPDFKEPRHLVTATPDVSQHRLRPGDAFIVLASDGLWDVLTDDEACEVVQKQLQQHPARPMAGTPLPDARLATAAAEALVQLALVKGTMDNVTAVVALLQWD